MAAQATIARLQEELRQVKAQHAAEVEASAKASRTHAAQLQEKQDDRNREIRLLEDRHRSELSKLRQDQVRTSLGRWCPLLSHTQRCVAVNRNGWRLCGLRP